MDIKLCLLVILVVYHQSAEAKGQRCTKKKQCGAHAGMNIKSTTEVPPEDPNPVINLNFTQSAEGVTLMNDAVWDQRGLTFVRTERQYAVLKDTIASKATCILHPGQCKGFTVSMLVNIKYCDDSQYLGILTTRTRESEGIRIGCGGTSGTSIIRFVVSTNIKHYIAKATSIDFLTRITAVFDRENQPSSYIYNGGKKQNSNIHVEDVVKSRSNGEVVIGKRETDSTRSLSGTVADLIVWNRVLTEEEIQAIGSAD